MWVLNHKKGNTFHEELKQARPKMGKEDKKEPFLTNLGRATMRGLRRCHKCGTLNGTRGYSCKNKSCDVVFKEAGGKKKSSTEPCKINTGSTAQIYSVRVRDKGPDYRGFVQLPTLHTNGNNLLLNSGFNDPELLLEGARCFVECCHKLNKYPISPQPSTAPCNHIKAAVQCYKESKTLSFKNSVLNSLPIPPQFKDEMFQLLTGTSGPLVQRVSKSLVVVKCKPDALHPLGFLHFSFVQAKIKKEGDHKFYCSCRTFKYHPTTKDTFRKCVHLYACIVAFASDDRLASEFSYYIDLIKNKNTVENLCLNLVVDKEELDESHGLSESEAEGVETLEDGTSMEESIEDVNEPSFFILNDSESGTPCQVEVEVVRDESDLINLPISTSDSVCTEEDIESKLEIQLQTEEGLHLHTSDGGTISVHQLPDNVSFSSLKRKQNDSVVQASSALLSLQKSASKKLDTKRLPSNFSCKKGRELCVESKVTLSFSSWIASVSERINQSMHYGFSGKPDPLVFHLPKSFFSCLIDRISKSIGSKKRKLMHETQTFIGKDTIPLGKFTKFTWKLTTLAQVQEIFSNCEIPLEVVRYFSLQKDGSYKPCKLPQPPPPTLPSNMGHQSGSHPIRPREYKTVLRVGIPCPSLLRDATPFILEWIPDILPKCRIGELRLKYEFDHYCNGQLVMKQPSILVSKTPLKSSKPLGPPLAPRPPQNKVIAPITSTENLLSIPISSDNLSSGDSITLLTF